jgi:hypothetical protein
MPSKEALIEALKEFGRVVMIAIVPVVIASLSEMKFDWEVIAVTGAIAGLRFIDKLLHETNKELPVKEQNYGYLGEKGITGF